MPTLAEGCPPSPKVRLPSTLLKPTSLPKESSQLIHCCGHSDSDHGSPYPIRRYIVEVIRDVIALKIFAMEILWAYAAGLSVYNVKSRL